MKCAEFEKHIVEATEQALPQALLESLEKHRQDCQSCARLAATIEQILRDDRPAEDTALSHRFWPLLLERIREHDSRGPAVGKLGFRPLALAACFFLAVWAGVHLGDSYVTRALASPSEQNLEEEIAPFLIVLDEIPRDSLAALLLQEDVQAGLEP